MIRTLLRHVREGFKNIGRNSWMTVAAIGSVVVSLMILGVFLTLAMNLQAFTKQIEGQVQMDVIVQQGVSRADISKLETLLKNTNGIKEVKFVSKEDGIQILRQQLKENAELLNGLEMENPLPDKFVVKAADPRNTLALADQIRTFPNVEKVQDGREVVQKLYNVVDIVRVVGGALVIGLMFTAIFLISNTIRITIFARRREIEIMKLVGATNWFIRWPFFIEGLIMGALGALIPILIIALGYSYVVRLMSNTLILILPLTAVIFQVGAALLLIGALIGMFGSAFSVRKFLKI
ncbi:permease-like cell division protein FtsX [Effusibacillus dendaii]|uniref:Cell division protein FtsX n=1 Tax=Effusibacillus dendaii TaxID=2743772 RepID=A0A7I8DCT9_9BACL|nr:permease-like cell division protein FtsX [Effusibacillus dendaii]BCJ87914.1 cell division protein FtsX [Effusibacillus dendaii]